MTRAFVLLIPALLTLTFQLKGQVPVESEWKKDRAGTPSPVKEQDAHVNRPPKWRFGLNGGYAHRLFRTGLINDKATQRYIQNLKSGIAFGGNVSYFHWEKVGLGLVYEGYQSKATAEDGLSEDVAIQHLSGSVIYRTFLRSHTTSVLTSFLVGYQPYHNKASLAGQQLTFDGKTMGWGVSVGIEQRVSRHLGINLTGSAMMGAIYRMKRKSAFNTEILYLSKDDQVDLSRVSLTLGLRFF